MATFYSNMWQAGAC